MRYFMLAIFLFLAVPGQAQPIRVQLVTGGHNHELSFYEVFQGNKDLKIDVNPHPGAFHSDMRKNVDVLVLYDMTDMDGETERRHLREFVEAGGLMTYSVSFPNLFRRAAYYVDRILKGARPADLPVEQPREFEFVINIKTAQALGLTIPQHVLLQATEVIQ